MPKLLAAHQLVSLAQLSLFTLVRNAPGVFESFGFAAGERPVLGAFLLFQSLIGPLDEVGGWVGQWCPVVVVGGMLGVWRCF